MPTTAPPQPTLREQALTALCLSDPVAKAGAAHALWSRWSKLPDDAARCHAIAPETPLSPLKGVALPGRPASPALVPPMSVPHRSPFTTEGLAALLHAITHIEFNAINLALDAVWRFHGMPPGFYSDWLRVADEEATHFGLLLDHLRSLGLDYGDVPAHDGLWEMCVKTQHDITARMALVPRTLEARGLDATPLIQARLRKVGTPAALRAVEILDVILRDEIGHVAIGNRWYGWLCEQQGLEPVAHYRVLARTHSAPRLKPPFHLDARRSAGFTEQEIDDLLGA
ncbi:MAG: ferritin-like domain-containing protein [Hydrogenophaga sp.]|uniref:ferritin-like domain-containing protein n=1 Tax=Hydrogenophaga sp. TaxID=1904254 RepID=UPI0025BBBD42|nr:ferritin-like domain-containing protein [Hydrogenophaga sp.]MBT9549906.1 ferritin-like domain-containing protein [Hydrogenophaga sp.]